ncbi:MAG: hypothetical protein IPM82_31135 [Saprospiraceae bacterium]|nr:hypothetical protein [Saprospiraceae bacterium]
MRPHRSAVNYAWCFDCVREENSLLLDFGEMTMELPAIDLVFYQPKKLLGENVQPLLTVSSHPFRLSGHDGRRQPEPKSIR